MDFLFSIIKSIKFELKIFKFDFLCSLRENYGKYKEQIQWKTDATIEIFFGLVFDSN